MKHVLITTEHRGVWFAEVEESNDLTKTTLTGLKNARMAIRWGTTNGLQELCEIGPNKNSKISSPSNISVLHKVTAVFEVTEAAAKLWKEL